MMRILLFLMTNVAVLVLLSITLSVLGVEPYLRQQGVGLDLEALLIFSAAFGMGGSFISLMISRWMAKRATGAVVITEPQDDTQRWLLDIVRRQSEAVGIRMPEVAIFPAPEMNAFATGARRDAALVAVSAGLLQHMSRDEVEAVLAHEIAHVANGDMVTMTLVQGVMNTFVIFFSRVIGYVVDRVILKNNRGFGIGYFASVIVAQIILGILASIVVMWFSRWREFRADAGGAELAGQYKMISALERLRQQQQRPLPESLAAFGVSGTKARFGRLFMSHPPLEERIRALKEGRH